LAGAPPQTPLRGAYNAPPHPLTGLRGPTSKRREGRKDGRERQGKGEKGGKGHTSKARGGKGGKGRVSPPNLKPNFTHDDDDDDDDDEYRALTAHSLWRRQWSM